MHTHTNNKGKLFCREWGELGCCCAPQLPLPTCLGPRWSPSGHQTAKLAFL